MLTVRKYRIDINLKLFSSFASFLRQVYPHCIQPCCEAAEESNSRRGNAPYVIDESYAVRH